jgi:hypothetical protein
MFYPIATSNAFPKFTYHSGGPVMARKIMKLLGALCLPEDLRSLGKDFNHACYMFVNSF